MIDKYTVHLGPEIKRLQAQRDFETSSVWQHLYSITPYIMTLGVSGKLPLVLPKLSRSSGGNPLLLKPTPVDIFRIQQAFKEANRLVSNAFLVSSRSISENLSVVVVCSFLPSGKRTKPLLEIRGIADTRGVCILEFWGT